VGFDAVQQARNWKEEEGSLLQVLAELYAHFESRRSLERKTQELQQRLTEARDAAQEAARAKSLFLANMSHEIRTPLNAILGYAQLMGRECMVKACPMSKRLGAIMRSGEHLLDLLTDLLELVRSDSQELKLSIGSFDFYQALEDVHLIFARQPAAQSLTLGFSCAPNVPQYICSDSGKVRQILVNLPSNARRRGASACRSRFFPVKSQRVSPSRWISRIQGVAFVRRR
jgi:two-component system sensor histidine kinase/response regulator